MTYPTVCHFMGWMTITVCGIALYRFGQKDKEWTDVAGSIVAVGVNGLTAYLLLRVTA